MSTLRGGGAGREEGGGTCARGLGGAECLFNLLATLANANAKRAAQKLAKSLLFSQLASAKRGVEREGAEGRNGALAHILAKNITSCQPGKVSATFCRP